MKRIAVAGFQHETNTFASTLAGFSDFEEADSWPGLLRGDEVIHGLSGINISITGFVDAAKEEQEECNLSHGFKDLISKGKDWQEPFQILLSKWPSPNYLTALFRFGQQGDA